MGEGIWLVLSVVFGILSSWDGAVAVKRAVNRGATGTLCVPLVDQLQLSIEV
jgi:hypothetical protein